MTARRRASRPACRDCAAPVVWFGNPFGPGTRPFDPAPLSGHRLPEGAVAYPVFGGQAWRFDQLVEHLMVAREVGRTDAESEARDVPWHRTHVCLHESTGRRRTA